MFQISSLDPPVPSKGSDGEQGRGSPWKICQKSSRSARRSTLPGLKISRERVNELLDQFEIQKKVKRGERIALTAGSRGIKDKPRVLKTIVERLKDLGASPFIVPCMGSHGGATAEGQTEVLESYGITEKSCGRPDRFLRRGSKDRPRRSSERLSSSIRIF